LEFNQDFCVSSREVNQHFGCGPTRPTWRSLWLHVRLNPRRLRGAALAQWSPKARLRTDLLSGRGVLVSVAGSGFFGRGSAANFGLAVIVQPGAI
jgi:hypothetical protein